MIFPWNAKERRHRKTPPKNATTKVIALFLIALLTGGLFVYHRYVSRYEEEKARLEQELKLNQANTNRARLKYEREQKAKQQERRFQAPGSQKGKGLPPGSIPNTPNRPVPPGGPMPGQGSQQVIPPTIIQPGKPR
jgi:hypothetical protein